MLKRLMYLTTTGAMGVLFAASPLFATDADSHEFTMVVSAGAKTCLPNATATVRIKPAGPVDVMDVTVQGLPANTDFDFFVIQVPKAPFGVAWYQGDIMTDKNGRGHQEFVGRFQYRDVHVRAGQPAGPGGLAGPFPDASVNPSFNPIQMYHLGLWCGSIHSRTHRRRRARRLHRLQWSAQRRNSGAEHQQLFRRPRPAAERYRRFDVRPQVRQPAADVVTRRPALRPVLASGLFQPSKISRYFTVSRTNGSAGISRRYPAEPLMPAIRPGDNLFGSTVDRVDPGRFALNDRFQMTSRMP